MHKFSFVNLYLDCMANLTKVAVGDLRVGMNIAQLDRPWLDTPFIMQGFEVEDREDINTIAEYCDFVWVDNIDPMQATPITAGVATATAAPFDPSLYATTDLQQEHKKTVRAFRQARSITKSLLDEVRLGGALDSEQARNTVDDCVKSVLRHPDALLWMSKMREENDYTSDHCLNVCVLAIAFGRHLGMQEEDLQNLGLCGLLHDLGKMRVPQEVVNKPGLLTDKEMRMMKAHTVHGRNLLLSAQNIYAGTIDVAYNHHERIDGEGYPRKLKGDAISRFAKIISIVDAYDAITAVRCYSPAKTSTQALKIIYEERGKQFDHNLSLSFIKMIGLYPPGSIVELYSGVVGLVIESNQHMRHLPKVILVLDENKKPVTREKLIDLSLISSGELSKDFLIRKVWLDGKFNIRIKDYQNRGLTLKF